MFGSFSHYDSGHYNHRMENLKHNPYVGTFHSTNRNGCGSPTRNNINNLLDSKNPFLPIFRHAPPAQVIAEGGLKSLLFENLNTKNVLKPFVTQVQVSEQIKQARKQLTPDALRHLPLSIFDLSTSRHDVNDDDLPICSICLDVFKDGDELRTLECSHCYHRRCIDIWLIGCLSDEMTDTSNCPQCRQSICTGHPSCDIPSSVFRRIGESLASVECMSDITSESGSIQDQISGNSEDTGIVRILSVSVVDDFEELQAPEVATVIEERHPLCESEYSDCGYPLLPR